MSIDASAASTKYFSAVAPPIDVEKNIIAKDILPISPTAIRYYTVNAVGTTSGNQGNTGLVFNIIPPSADGVMSRLLRIRLTYKVTILGRCKQNVAQNADRKVINSAYSGFCSLPINSSIATMTLTINNASTTVRSSQVVRDLLRYDDPEKLMEGVMSQTPVMPDVAGDYAMITNFIASPFGSHGDGKLIDDVSRNAFQLIFEKNPQAGPSNGPSAEAIVKATFVEPLIIPPLVYTEDWFYYPGFANVRSVAVNITFDTAELGRVFRRARNYPEVDWDAGYPIVEIIDTLQLIVGWYTMNPSQKIPPILNYKYSNIVNYVTQSDQVVPQSTLTGTDDAVQTINYGHFTITSNSIQLSSIPRAVVLSVTKRGKTFRDPDFYFPFGANPASGPSVPNIINITFNNQSGILSTATVEDLYMIARKNGLYMSFPVFAGELIRYFNGAVSAPSYGLKRSLAFTGSGGPLLLLFGIDIPLSADDYVGKKGLYSFQVEVNCINNLFNPDVAGIENPYDTNNPPKPQLNVIIIYDGWMRINNDVVTFDVGIPDGFVPALLEKTNYPVVDYMLRGGGLQGGSLFGTLGKLVKSIPIVGDVLGGLFGGDEEEEKQSIARASPTPQYAPAPQYVQPVVRQIPQYVTPAIRQVVPKALPEPSTAKTGGRYKNWHKYIN